MSYEKLPQEILLAGVLSVFSGATEIRTREPVVPVTRFPANVNISHKHLWFNILVIFSFRSCADFALTYLFR